ncbi:MAG: helix-turn-helix domain-containing protein [Candidatus Bathyarchaeota archaeon]
MEFEEISDMLVDLGLSKNEAKVYLYLATNGEKRVKEISQDLEIKKQQLYPTLKEMKKIHIVETRSVNPKFFSAVPFEIVLEALIGLKFDQSTKILENKEKLVSYWQSVDWNNGK